MSRTISCLLTSSKKYCKNAQQAIRMLQRHSKDHKSDHVAEQVRKIAVDTY